jgi:CxxC motif-containing protein (DUF1111 family)
MKALKCAFFIPLFLVLFTSSQASSDFLGRPGGIGTVVDATQNAFGHPFPDASVADRRAFFVGNSFFRNAWVAAPASPEARDGLGPTFNAVSCGACHGLDGRGRAFTHSGEVDISLLFRLSAPDESGVWRPDPNYGDQLNPQALDGVPGEGRMVVDFEEFEVAYPDGRKVKLRRPIFRIDNLAFGPLAPGAKISPRVAPHLAGLGLVEAIAEADILLGEDPLDRDGDGVSGRANYVVDRATQTIRLGRFGWKAGQPSLRQQNAGAFLGDMGITSSLFPDENCPSVQVDCSRAINGGSPELSDQVLDRVTTYTQLLAVPDRRIADPIAFSKGRENFKSVGCVSCHRESFVTGNHSQALLVNQTIFPYSDFLLHDMGPELADGRPDGLATGTEWRTPPLWGIGLFPVVNQHSNLLHDGRARGVEEAILWHGGEAEAAKRRFMALSQEDRSLLIGFLNSI